MLYGTDFKKSVVPCRLNPLNLACTCKGSRHHGICSHILAVSHLRAAIDLNAETAALAPKKPRHRPKRARGRTQIQHLGQALSRMSTSSERILDAFGRIDNAFQYIHPVLFGAFSTVHYNAFQVHLYTLSCI